MDSLFSGCSGFERVDLSGLAGSSPKEMNYLFMDCSSIEEIDLTALDVSRAKTLNYLFYNCGKLRRLDLSSFDTSGVIQMEDMFGNDASLKEVRLGHGFSFCGAKQEPLCQLPSSVGTHLLGWRNSSGRVYAASEIPANQAETYRSGIVLDADLICLFSRYYVYDGSPVSLILTTGLAEGVDYTASYIDNVEVGTGSVTFEGINDYLGSLTFDFDISQGVPQVGAPEGIAASWGQRLSEVALPDGWTWDNPDQVVTSSKDYVDARATFTPEDTRNYVSVAKVVRVQIDCDGSWAWDGRGWWWSGFDGTYPRSCWKKIGGSWYLFDAAGYMLDGWQSAGGGWYWLGGSGDGAMRTGWQKIAGVWYWFDGGGAMATGWRQVGGSWYLFSGSGAMLTGWQCAGGIWYWLGSSGAMATGWLNLGGTWYYLGDSGAMAAGWFQVGDVWYWADASGAMAHDRWVGDYYVTSSGAMATSTRVDGYWVDADGKWVPGA